MKKTKSKRWRIRKERDLAKLSRVLDVSLFLHDYLAFLENEPDYGVLLEGPAGSDAIIQIHDSKNS